MAPGCGWSLGGEMGQDQVSSGSHSPGALVLSTVPQQEGACHPRAALPGLSVAESGGALAL